MLSKAVLRPLLLQRQCASALLPMRAQSDQSSDVAPPMQRPTRPTEPGKVRLGFIPEEWFSMFYKKTGVTGPYTLGVGVLTYLFSKEIYVMEHEFYGGMSLAIMAIVAVKKLGPGIGKYLDKEVEAVENEWKAGRENEIKQLTEAIKNEKKEQWRAEGASILMDAKRENVMLQLEAAFRQRSMQVYREVKRRLDYQVECRNIERRLSQKHQVNWIISEVLKSISPEQEKETLKKCIADLSAMAVAGGK